MYFIDFNPNFGSETPTLIWFVFTITLAWLVLFFLYLKTYGFKKTLRYFLPIIIAGFFIESAGAASGRYVYPNYMIYLSIFENGWVPLSIILGWSVNLILFYNISRFFVNKFYKRFDKIRIFLIAFFAGFFAVCLDLLEDPLAHHNKWWIWNDSLSGVHFYQVPIINFVGWFLLLFYLSISIMLIERSGYSENRKLLLSISSLSISGLAILVTHGLIFRFLQIMGIS
ncbi:MAG: carotenoid biosynthesis protein [Candidatus Thermoplasmatota archaeon]